MPMQIEGWNLMIVVPQLDISDDFSTICYDNSSIVAVAVNPILHSKFKDVELDLFFVHEKVADGSLVVGEVPACDQVVDVLTKPLFASSFAHFRNILQVLPVEKMDVCKLERPVQDNILYNLLMLENQLPFFVLFELHRMIMGNGEDKNQNPNVHENLYKATELEEPRINFHGVVKDNDGHQLRIVGLFDIIFNENTKELRIPTLHVDDDPKSFFCNFMAYEQFIPSGEPTFVLDYMVIMDSLVNTGKDVHLLCNNGIVANWLGDEEAVAQMFNKLLHFINSPEDFYYIEIFDKEGEHCQKKWNKWKARLKKDYFNSFWSFISFLVALPCFSLPYYNFKRVFMVIFLVSIYCWRLNIVGFFFILNDV
ncbi:hypothetical protein Gohar_001428, partial [Gossypium harknessii]|nr:hypothetical protein [Gossypium harknessii]